MDLVHIHFLLLSLLVIFSILAALNIRIIKAAILLAVVSLLTALILFLLETPLAAIFELSVCAGLITVIFISVISLTNPLTREERIEEKAKTLKRFVFLPGIVLVCAAAFYMLENSTNFIPIGASEIAVAQEGLWNSRQFDLIGQIIIILAGVFGVIVLFKDNKDDGGKK
ncbi:MAG: hypothetical protein FWF00_07285 [Endomicrobia bacterium]|nr:hypothetical protein [Endomicrobiia bacterium]MCL2507470.1 hypothetical protein [Endomicrobiia bacterium]